jgi:hypothetical protein
VGQDIGKGMRFTKDSEKLETSIETSTLAPGVYLVQIEMGGRTVTRKWVKK